MNVHVYIINTYVVQLILYMPEHVYLKISDAHLNTGTSEGN